MMVYSEQDFLFTNFNFSITSTDKQKETFLPHQENNVWSKIFQNNSDQYYAGGWYLLTQEMKDMQLDAVHRVRPVWSLA